MSNRRFDKADFDGIIENLIEYLSGQSQFKDYNFEASGIRTIIELLAYNTQYNLFYLNQVANESFLDSSTIRGSAVSLAKHLGYRPRSVRASKAVVNVTINKNQLDDNVEPPSSLLLSTSSIFTTSVNSVKYFLTPNKNYFAKLVGDTYVFNNVELLEGKRLTHSFTVNTENENQKFILPNENIDDRSLVVSVKDSSTSSTELIFQQHTDLNELDGESRVYFLQETSTGYLELIFGDGILGKKLENNNVVNVSYIVSSGNDIYNASSFKLEGGIGLFTTSTVTTVEKASQYQERESLESIKKFAPLAYETQNRAITKKDYEILLSKDIPDIEFLRVWGGEENVPPINGVVFISAKPKNRSQYTTQEKDYLINTIVKSRSSIAVESRFVDPEIINLNFTTSVRYDSNLTLKDDDQITADVLNSIQQFRTENLTGFNTDFRYSKLIQKINEADPAILSNLTSVKLKYRLYPPFNVPTDYKIELNNNLSSGDVINGIHSIDSTGFLFGGIVTYIQDDGLGGLQYYRKVGINRVVVANDIGSVDYNTGEINLQDLSVQSLPNQVTYLDIYANPRSNDVISDKSKILVLDDFDIDIFVERV